MRDRDGLWWGGLALVLVVEVVLAGSRRADDARALARGDLSWETTSAVAGLVWLPVMVVALLVTLRHLVLLQRAGHMDAQTIRADATAYPGWAWTADPGLVITGSNDRVEDLLGWRVEEVLGRPTADFLLDGDDARWRGARRGLQDGTGWSEVTARWRHRDGHAVELIDSATCILDRRGRVVAVRGTRHALDQDQAARGRLERRRRTVREALARGDVRAALQPIVDLTTGRSVGAEALARFPDGRSPGEWFDEADAVGLGVELELLALDRALGASSRLPLTAYLSVNLSPQAMLDERSHVLLRDGRVPLGRLVLEVTEHVEVHRYEALTAVLAPLRGDGLRLAVDDAGAGYASFQHVLRLRPDIVKLDRSLVAGLDSDGGCRAFVTAVVLVGLELGALVTAEGVETEAELRVARELGVDCAQGFLLGRPTEGTVMETPGHPWWG